MEGCWGGALRLGSGHKYSAVTVPAADSPTWAAAKRTPKIQSDF